MSGICGWCNNQLPPEQGTSILLKMADELNINHKHRASTGVFDYCALATAGIPHESGIHHENGLFAAIQGSVRWMDSKLSFIARKQGPAHALAEAYRQHGIGCLQKISGPFALSLIDEINRKTLLAIDKLGINTLFYTEQSGQLIFASNARAIRHHSSSDKGLDPQAVFDYLYFHMVPGPRCIFNGVEKLLPGEYLVYEKNQIVKNFYWQPTYIENSHSNEEKLKVEFLEILKASVSRAAEDSMPGAFLSGGTDSSTIAGMLRAIKHEPVDTYSIGFNAEGYDEMEYARLAARHFGTRPHEYYLTAQDVVDTITLIARAYDEPFGNASVVPAYFCAKLANADGLDTLLAGDGGDELFGGNERYAKQKFFELYQQIPKTLRTVILEPVILNCSLADRISLIAKAQSYIRQANVPLPDRLESYNFLNRMPLAEILDADFLAVVNVDEPRDLLRETYARTSAKTSLNRMLFLDLKFTLADNDLRKVNRMCELAQMEVRYPMLDEELVRFSTQLPASFKVRGYQLRYFFKQALKNFLPAETLAKSKHGFGLPFGVWMNNHDPLREIALDSLSSLSRRGIIRIEFIEELRQRHLDYPGYYGVLIWVLMMLEQWLQSGVGVIRQN